MLTATAKDIMIKDVITVDENWPIDRLTTFLIEHSITGAPVISKDGFLVGVVSLTDIARHAKIVDHTVDEDRPHDYYLHSLETVFNKHDLSSLDVTKGQTNFVQDIMTPIVFEVNEDTPVQQVADAMIRGRIHRVLVTKEDRIVGIITSLDMLKLIKEM